MPNSDFLDRARADWVRSINIASGPGTPPHKEWTSPTAIADALSPIMGTNRNHAHLPDGGGRDFVSVDPSHEPGCLDFHVGPRTIYRMKPRRLIMERIDADLVQSFMLLDLGDLAPTGIYPVREPDERRRERFGQEEMVEVGAGEHYERSAWDEGETPDGDELPPDAKLLVRFFGGKILFVTKGSIWNGSASTYDGRHSKMTAAEIRSIIDGVIERASRT